MRIPAPNLTFRPASTTGARRKAAVTDYVTARSLADRAAEAVKKAEARLVAILDEDEVKSSSITVEGVKYTVSVTERTTIAYDEPGLKKALGAKRFTTLTTAKLDRHKLESAVSEGDIDAQVVAAHATVTPGARTLRLTRKVDTDSEAATS